MPHAALADFIEELEQAGELVRVAAQVEADLEIAAIVDRVVGGGRALFFERVAGQRPPVVANLLGSEVASAARWRQRRSPNWPSDWPALFRRTPRAGSIGSRAVSRAARWRGSHRK